MCEKQICLYCKKYLKSIGTQRKNGKISNNYSHDWNSRKYHKKCLKMMEQEYRFKLQMEEYEKKFKNI